MKRFSVISDAAKIVPVVYEQEKFNISVCDVCRGIRYGDYGDFSLKLGFLTLSY